jgi:hypothetical protein
MIVLAAWPQVLNLFGTPLPLGAATNRWQNPAGQADGWRRRSPSWHTTRPAPPPAAVTPPPAPRTSSSSSPPACTAPPPAPRTSPPPGRCPPAAPAPGSTGSPYGPDCSPGTYAARAAPPASSATVRAPGGEEQFDRGAGKWGNEVDGDEAGRVVVGRRRAGLQAPSPGIDGAGGDALPIVEVRDSQAAAVEAVGALVPVLTGGGVGSSAGLRRGRHRGSSQRQGRSISLLDLSRT